MIYKFFFFLYTVPADNPTNITGTEMKPTLFCEQFLPPDKLPNPPLTKRELSKRKNEKETKNKNIKLPKTKNINEI